MNAKPKIKDRSKIKICFICEGSEEEEYIKRLSELNVWSEQFTYQTINSEGISKIFPVYQSKFQNAKYDLLLIFCDTESEPYSDFKKLKIQIERMHGRKISDKVIMFANPCSMQIILQHFGSIKLNSADKTRNMSNIKKLTGVEEYRATCQQRKMLFSKIDETNYLEMKKRVEKLPKKFDEIGSTNFSEWLLSFESEESAWVKKINKVLER